MLRALLRKLRGIAGMALSWAIGWGAVFGLTAGLIGLFGLTPAPGMSQVVAAFQVTIFFGTMGAVLGFLTGSVFSLVLMAAERKRRLSDLRTPRFALWGAAAGGMALLPIVFSGLAEGSIAVGLGSVFVSVAAGLGAASAVASLKTAQSGSAPGELLPTADENALAPSMGGSPGNGEGD